MFKEVKVERQNSQSQNLTNLDNALCESETPSLLTRAWTIKKYNNKSDVKLTDGNTYPLRGGIKSHQVVNKTSHIVF